MDILDIDPLSILPFEKTPTYKPFLAECVEEARKRGYLGEEENQAFKEKHIHIGAAVGHYTYLHHKNTQSHDVAVLSSLLMAFYYCIDDYGFEAKSVTEYGSRLVSGRPQLEKGLNDLATLSAELSSMYDPVTGDLLRMSTQAYVMGNHLEREMCGLRTQWEVNKNAPLFPTIMKTITSAATSLYLLSFPCSAPATSYMQTLPDGICVHDTTADIMSYYKEAIEGEFNRVEQTAQMHNMTGPDMLEELVKNMKLSHKRVIDVLSASDPSGSLVSCYTSTIVGFVVFQALHPRYKIKDFNIFSF
ncbi:hypothetical protein GYMLUDRAFT_247756 [Collybiopsis luxurians FD-317 M1]|uniref:Unplaced genomic scaffold GYMLUscaffold_49, whole genome shotgun sequence n=1 Tax=Collybiopsis luxurians FD-317 M1 TaxID=944289 RepID=A0A0D0B0E9_9AGAR|nr:hypothetical protein GYMLUDRAFT_247756 [Collybiopsis luxurians FD-317 M1]